MTSDSTIFSRKTALSPNPAKYTVDGSHMPISHIGSISTSNLSVNDNYLVPKLSLNLLSVGQLCELGLELKFSNNGVDVQDSQTGQLLGTSRKVGRLFELSIISADSFFKNNFHGCYHSHFQFVALSVGSYLTSMCPALSLLGSFRFS